MRPKIDIPLTSSAKVMELLALLILIGLGVFTAVYFPQLPDVIPTHFRGNGEVDGYGGKWTFILLPCVAMALYLLLTITARYPHKMNYMATITEENALRHYSIVKRMFRIMKITVLIVFFMISYQTVQVALGWPDLLQNWFMLILMALIFVPVFYFLILSSKNS